MDKKKYLEELRLLGEEVQQLEEKNCPTNPSKWSYYKSQAKQKFDVYPSAYANGWASKQYKAAGGGWKQCAGESVNEEQINEWKLQLDLGKVNPSEFENWASDSLQKKHKIKVSGSGRNWTIVGKGNDDRMGSSADWISQLLGKAWKVNKIKVVQKESVNEAASRTAMEIGGLTGMNKDAIQKFVDDNKLDIEKVYQYVKNGKLPERMALVSAIAGRPNNPVQKKIIKMFGESIDEGMVKPRSGHNYYQLTKDTPIKYISGHSGIGLEVPGVLLHNEYDTIKGKKGAYIIDYFGQHFYVDMKNKFASAIVNPKNREQNNDLMKNVEQVSSAPDHSDWKKYMKESVAEMVEDHSSNPNDKYVVKPCDEPGTPWAVWEGPVRVKGFASKEEAEAYADSQNKKQGLGESKMNKSQLKELIREEYHNVKNFMEEKYGFTPELGKVIDNPYVSAFKVEDYLEEGGETDAEMAVDQMETMVKRAQELIDKLRGKSNLEPWVQSLITKAEDYISTVSDYGEVDEYDVENYQDVKEFAEFMESYKPSINEAEYQGRKVELNKIMQGDVKKFKVYVNNDKGNVVKVNFGQGGDAKGGTMRIRKDNPEARKSFRARHNCDNPGPRWKARYWSCRKW